MNIYDFNAKDINGENISLSKYKGKVLLIVNVASKCGFTPQYKALQKLYETYKEQGFMVLGFPCNQFSQQEPHNNETIQSFCKLNYGVTFDMFSKIEVNGEKTIDVYAYLKKEARGIFGTEKIKWNFTKFLISKQGEVVMRYAPITKPENIKNDIELLLKK